MKKIYIYILTWHKIDEGLDPKHFNQKTDTTQQSRLFKGQTLKWNSRQKATEALFVTEYESNLHVNA